MAAMILCVLVMLALCVLKLVKRTDYRRESDYFYENNLDEYGENEAYTSEYIDYSKAYQPKWLFSYNEKAFYQKLKTFADRNGLFLFAKVRLLDLVEPRRGQQKYKTYFYKIQAKHVDFVLCDAKLVARWVIELDDTSVYIGVTNNINSLEYSKSEEVNGDGRRKKEGVYHEKKSLCHCPNSHLVYSFVLFN